MSQPRPPRRCPACGHPYGLDGTRCYPGVPQVRTRNGRGIAARCEVHGTLEVPPAMPNDIRGVVREFRAAGAGWETVRAWLRKFGLAMPEQPMDPPMRPTTRGAWPPPTPSPTPRGPRPPVPRDPSLPPGAPSVPGRRPYVDRAQESDARSRVCPESVSGHGAATLEGLCPYCGARLTGRNPMPKVTDRTRLGEEYRRHYDPDHGTDPHDT